MSHRNVELIIGRLLRLRSGGGLEDEVKISDTGPPS